MKNKIINNLLLNKRNIQEKINWYIWHWHTEMRKKYWEPRSKYQIQN